MCIYKIANARNSECYVGSAVDVDARWAIHLSLLRSGKHHSLKLQRAWLKYGESEFVFSIVEIVGDSCMLLSREQHWIDYLRAFGVGYNMAPKSTSSLGIKRSPETRKRISIAKSGQKRQPLSEATKKKIAAAHLGKPKPPHTQEQRAARTAWQTGRRHTPDTIAKMCAAQKGRTFSDETRRKMSESHKRRFAENQMSGQAFQK